MWRAAVGMLSANHGVEYARHAETPFKVSESAVGGRLPLVGYRLSTKHLLVVQALCVGTGTCLVGGVQGGSLSV